MTALEPNYNPKPLGMVEEVVKDVPKIAIDSLVPKNVVRQDKQIIDLDMGRSTCMSPKLKIKKKRVSLMGSNFNSSIHSIQESSQKTNVRQSVTSFASNGKSKKQNPCVPLSLDPQDDSDIKQVRAKKDAIVQQQ